MLPYRFDRGTTIDPWGGAGGDAGTPMFVTLTSDPTRSEENKPPPPTHIGF